MARISPQGKMSTIFSWIKKSCNQCLVIHLLQEQPFFGYE